MFTAPQPVNAWLAAVVGTSLALQIVLLIWPPARLVFDTVALTPPSLVLAGVLAVAPAALMWVAAHELGRLGSGGQVIGNRGRPSILGRCNHEHPHSTAPSRVRHGSGHVCSYRTKIHRTLAGK
jgi:hypothetical protein